MLLIHATLTVLMPLFANHVAVLFLSPYLLLAALQFHSVQLYLSISIDVCTVLTDTELPQSPEISNFLLLRVILSRLNRYLNVL